MGSLELVKKCLLYTKNRKKWVLVLCALGFTGYGAYEIYNLPSVVKKRERLSKLMGASISVAEMLSDSAEAFGILSKDLKQFIQSDSNEIPLSLKQIYKMTLSNEFHDSLARITRAFSVGILQAYGHEMTKNGYSMIAGSDLSDRIADNLFSSAGSGFASVVVGSFARNSVMAFCSEFLNADHSSSMTNENFSMWAEFICDQYKFRELIGYCTQVFVSTAVAVETIIHTAHHVLNTDSGAVSKPDFDHSSKIDLNGGFFEVEKTIIGRKPSLSHLNPRKFKNRDRGFVGKMSSTLAVPRNRKLVLDMTGAVAFETVRSFLEFSLEKLSDSVKRSVGIAHEEMADRGSETVRYVSDKSSAVTSVCIALCLSILNSPWILVNS
ncbi:protein PHLOEM PROTEIN 2-LIKE A10-like [Primulina eburnea]|uniref:protein PHLOEM PROTEIN 2-LIKE A10-like n=1 Tax=Primulina eburnea TaxID=1245227 RepID=UPI003C6BFD30